jgi:ergothioneine biosynthesis protein EgtB
MTPALFPRPLEAEPLTELFRQVRARTARMAEGLAPEDMTVQSMEDASPVKWHLAHVSWFFEEFVLRPHSAGWRSPDDRFAFLFNSYYVQAGPRYTRAQRGLVTRPTAGEVMDYRAAVEDGVERLLAAGDAPRDLVELGCHHEMQHQELILTDLLHALSHNPMRPAYRAPGPLPTREAAPLDWVAFPGGLVEIGHGGDGFAYDCEGPAHKTYLRPYALASRAVTCGEWMAFIEDDGYARAPLWLSDGFATAEREGWTAPLYWWREDGRWMQFTLRGAQPVDPDAPVAHVSYYEADAFARWSGARLPTEAEWEAAGGPVGDGVFMESERLRPAPAAGDALTQMWGDVWEWTGSAFLPYPGFRPPDGAVGEYNGKFMVNQFVLRGGSALTPRAQLRSSYRNFFHPHARWQMTGLRLARDV